MKYYLDIHPRVPKEDMAKLDKPIQKKIIKDIRSKLLLAPLQYGEPLRSPLTPSYKLRVGNYRVVFRVEGKVVKIGRIGHRSKIYGSEPVFRDF